MPKSFAISTLRLSVCDGKIVGIDSIAVCHFALSTFTSLDSPFAYQKGGIEEMWMKNTYHLVVILA